MFVNTRFLDSNMTPLTNFFLADIEWEENEATGAVKMSHDTHTLLRQIKAQARGCGRACCIEVSPTDRAPGLNPKYLGEDGRFKLSAELAWHWPGMDATSRKAADTAGKAKARTLYADEETWATLRTLGKGNVSQGLRVAVLSAYTLNPPPEALNPSPAAPAPSRFVDPGPITPGMLAAGALVVMGSQLRALRIGHKLKQREAAELAGVGVDTWKKLEQQGGNGVRKIKPGMVARFLQRTGWTPPKEDMSDLLA